MALKALAASYKDFDMPKIDSVKVWTNGMARPASTNILIIDRALWPVICEPCFCFTGTESDLFILIRYVHECSNGKGVPSSTGIVNVSGNGASWITSGNMAIGY